MIDLAVTMMGAASKRLTEPTGVGAAPLLLSVVVFAITVFLRLDESETLPASCV